MQKPNPNLILSVGSRIVTKVDTRPIGGGGVCPAGIVGIVIAAPVDNEHAYRVRYVNGVVAHVQRTEV